jgi:hypothetical protein
MVSNDGDTSEINKKFHGVVAQVYCIPDGDKMSSKIDDSTKLWIGSYWNSTSQTLTISTFEGTKQLSYTSKTYPKLEKMDSLPVKVVSSTAELDASTSPISAPSKNSDAKVDHVWLWCFLGVFLI